MGRVSCDEWMDLGAMYELTGSEAILCFFSALELLG
jgi:hypothetical protein